MISYFDELKLAGKAEGKIEGKIETRIEDIHNYLTREFESCPSDLIEKCVRINDFEILDRIWNFALFKAQDLDEIIDYVDSEMIDAGLADE